MQKFFCDQCHKEMSGMPLVVIKGVSSFAGDILLPDRFHEKHFCKPGCFWEWAKNSLFYHVPRDEALVRFVINTLEKSERMGTEEDIPEGGRYIQISDTLAQDLTYKLMRALEPKKGT